MKREFIAPSMKVRAFNREMILTDSTTNAQVAEAALNEDLAGEEGSGATVVGIATVNVNW